MQSTSTGAAGFLQQLATWASTLPGSTASPTPASPPSSAGAAGKPHHTCTHFPQAIACQAEQLCAAVQGINAEAPVEHGCSIQEARSAVQADTQQLLQAPASSKAAILQQLLHTVAAGPTASNCSRPPAPPLPTTPAATTQTAAAAAAIHAAAHRSPDSTLSACIGPTSSSSSLPDMSGVVLVPPEQRAAAAQPLLTQLDVNALGQLPAEALHHALLLQPTLLSPLLAAMAEAAVSPGFKQPPSSPPACLTAATPCWRHLPVVLAAQPDLLLQTRATLHSWMRSSNHPALWLLLSQLLRPAWQQLMARWQLPEPSLAAPSGAAAPCTSRSPAIDAQRLHPQQQQQQRQSRAAAAAPRGHAVATMLHHHPEKQQQQQDSSSDTLSQPAPGSAPVQHTHPMVAACCTPPLLPLMQLLVLVPSAEGLQRVVQLLQQLGVVPQLAVLCPAAVEAGCSWDAPLPSPSAYGAAEAGGAGVVWDRVTGIASEPTAAAAADADAQQAGVAMRPVGTTPATPVAAAAADSVGDLEPWELGWPDEMDWCAAGATAAAACSAGDLSTHLLQQQQQQQRGQGLMDEGASGDRVMQDPMDTWQPHLGVFCSTAAADAAPAAATAAATVAANATRSKAQLATWAWQLLLEHRCWYEAALWWLAREALQAMSTAAAENPSSGATSAAAAAAGAAGASAAAADPGPGLCTASRQCNAQQPGLGVAVHAAVLISWVQEPHGPQRQAGVCSALLEPLLRQYAQTQAGATSAMCSSKDGISSSSPVPLSSTSTRAGSEATLQAARQLLQQWQQALQQPRPSAAGAQVQQPRLQQPGVTERNVQQQQQQLSSTGTDSRAHYTARHAWLAAVDLPCALLQQQQVLLQVSVQQLVSHLLLQELQPAAGGSQLQQHNDEQQQQQQQQPGHCADAVDFVRGGQRGLLAALHPNQQHVTRDNSSKGAATVAAPGDGQAPSGAPQVPRTQQREHRQPATAAGRVPLAVLLPQLLQCCDTLSAAALGLLQAQLMPSICSSLGPADSRVATQRAAATPKRGLSQFQQQRQQQQPTHWLTGLWLQESKAVAAAAAAEGGREQGTQGRGLALGKQLVLAATALDRQLKQYGNAAH